MDLFADGQRFFSLKINGGCAAVGWQQPFPHGAAKTLILGDLVGVVNDRPDVGTPPSRTWNGTRRSS